MILKLSLIYISIEPVLSTVPVKKNPESSILRNEQFMKHDKELHELKLQEANLRIALLQKDLDNKRIEADHASKLKKIIY